MIYNKLVVLAFNIKYAKSYTNRTVIVFRPVQLTVLSFRASNFVTTQVKELFLQTKVWCFKVLVVKDQEATLAKQLMRLDEEQVSQFS